SPPVTAVVTKSCPGTRDCHESPISQVPRHHDITSNQPLTIATRELHPIGRSTRLLAVNSGSLIKRAHTPLPKPLLIHVHPASTFTDVDYLSEQVLKFTSLSWRSTLPVHTPVTIFYSERIAELLGRLRNVPQWSTTALDVKLRYSRWFL
ncbi:MAG: hypothetical protein OXE86_01945, partial [Alphaproteobacteria bacterium]|nr:hypothetical protein [Alphaproteobacteria bacterium]